MKPLIGTANLLAGQAVSLAEGFIAGRIATSMVEHKTVFLFADLRRLRAMQADFPTSSIIDAANMLTIALRNACAAPSDDAKADPFAIARAGRWRELLAPMIEHVRRESLKLNEEGHFA